MFSIFFFGFAFFASAAMVISPPGWPYCSKHQPKVTTIFFLSALTIMDFLDSWEWSYFVVQVAYESRIRLNYFLVKFWEQMTFNVWIWATAENEPSTAESFSTIVYFSWVPTSNYGPTTTIAENDYCKKRLSSDFLAAQLNSRYSVARYFTFGAGFQRMCTPGNAIFESFTMLLGRTNFAQLEIADASMVSFCGFASLIAASIFSCLPYCSVPSSE